MSEKAPLSQVRDAAEGYFETNRQIVHRQEIDKSLATQHEEMAKSLDDEADRARAAVLPGENEKVGLAVVAALVKDAQSQRESAVKFEEAATKGEMPRKANLWDSHEDYQNNQEAYQEAAIEDANAAGHDIDFGGKHYPAQQPEEPKELQHQ